MEPLISVIVPIYNVEKYLNKCLDSIINQTLTNIEIILIDDGSTDNSGKIIDEYSNKDKRIVAIHSKNQGQSAARNIGLDIAKGKYIGFVDSDDWIDKDMYLHLYNIIERTSSDISVCGRRAFGENGKLNNRYVMNEQVLELNENNIDKYIVNELLYKHTVVVWNKLYKKSLIEKNNIRFKNVTYVGSEDMLFNYSILCNVNKIATIEKVLYNQLSREGSTARTYKEGYMFRTANLLNNIRRYSEDIDKAQIAKKVMPGIFLFYYQWNLSQIKKMLGEKNSNNIIVKEIEEGVKNRDFNQCVKYIATDIKIIKYMREIGYKSKGILFIKITMLSLWLKSFKLATKMILIK